MSAWRPARASMTIKSAVMGARKGLPSAGFGMVGDTSHAARPSDHNPAELQVAGGRREWIVRAVDVPLAVGDGGWKFAKRMRALARGSKLRRRKPHPAFGSRGYIIANHKIASSSTGWRFIPYHGTNPHTSHVHLSWGLSWRHFDTPAPFHIRRKDVT